MKDRIFRFPALNIKGVGRVELFARHEDEVRNEAITIFRVICMARYTSGALPKSLEEATVCDMHATVGRIIIHPHFGTIYEPIT
jgi:hypothetical protein